jgi:hypothetical protein
MNAPIGKTLSLEAPPELKIIQTKDQAGRTITTFEGHPRDWMREFMQPQIRRVASIRTRNHA